MKIAVLTNSDMKEELMATCKQKPENVLWHESEESFFSSSDADIFLDLLFEYDIERINNLSKLLPKTIIINSVIHTLEESHSSFIRFNGWPTLLKSNLLEACGPINQRENAENAFHLFGKKAEWVKDIPGFISARVISMIINEAYYLLKERISTREEIDLAMKLGTNYPYGPFEWSAKIGTSRICNLLERLSAVDQSYQPCPSIPK